jgi:hypothetical protein
MAVLFHLLLLSARATTALRPNERSCQVCCLSFPPVEDGEQTVAQIKTGFPVFFFFS